jgi:hypothetical protein
MSMHGGSWSPILINSRTEGDFIVHTDSQGLGVLYLQRFQKSSWPGLEQFVVSVVCF